MSSVARRKPRPIRPAPTSPRTMTPVEMPPKGEDVLDAGVVERGAAAAALGVGLGTPVISPGAATAATSAAPDDTGTAAVDAPPDEADVPPPVVVGQATTRAVVTSVAPVSNDAASKPGDDVTATRAPPSVTENVLGIPLGVPMMSSEPAVNEALAPDFSSFGVLTNSCRPDCDSAWAASSLAVAFSGCDVLPMCTPVSSTVAGWPAIVMLWTTVWPEAS